MEKEKITKKPRVEKVNVEAQAAEEPIRIEAKQLDPHQLIRVINGFQGELVYRSRKTGELFRWDGFGDDQDMELSELKSAKSASKKFFINNWFMFDEDWVVDYLGMGKYYKHAVNIDDFDDIFEHTAAEIEKIVTAMSAGQKKSVAYRARQLIEDGVIDSNKKISTLEKCLGIELIER